MSISIAKRIFIESLADEICIKYDVERPIQNIENLVEDLGGLVEYHNNLFGEEGKITKSDNSFIISVSSLLPQERINFTIAHELGHLFLHMGFLLDDDLWKSQKNEQFFRSGYSQTEFEANEFAASLLMPRKKFKEISDQYSNGNTVNTTLVAEYFHVSTAAASNRGKWLGYYSWEE